MIAQPLDPTLCTEPDCGYIREDRIHSDYEKGHFFNPGAPLLQSRVKPRKKKPLATVTPIKARRPTSAPSLVPDSPQVKPEPLTMERYTPAGRDFRLCRICRKQKTNHRGTIKHQFTPLEATLDFSGPTSAQITEAVELALRSLAIAPRLRIQSVKVEPHYAVDSDSEMLSARVLVDVRLVFPKGQS